MCLDENAACTLNGDVYQCSCVYGYFYVSSTDSCETSKHILYASCFMDYHFTLTSLYASCFMDYHFTLTSVIKFIFT